MGGAPVSGPVIEVLERSHAPAERVWDCYRQCFDDVADYETWHADLFERHAAREGYRLVVASEGSRVVGFSWGYTGAREPRAAAAR